MVFIFLMHWHAIGALEQSTKDMIRRFQLWLWRYMQFGRIDQG